MDELEEHAGDPCPLCGGAITDQMRIGHWREYSGAGGLWYEGRCRACDVDFHLTSPGRSSTVDPPPGWYLDAPEVDWLREPLNWEEVAEFGKRVMDSPRFSEKWQRFLLRARAEDHYWSYSHPNLPESVLPVPVARVRGHVPVAWFAPIDNLLLVKEPEVRTRAVEEADVEQARLERRRRRKQQRHP